MLLTKITTAIAASGPAIDYLGKGGVIFEIAIKSILVQATPYPAAAWHKMDMV